MEPLGTVPDWLKLRVNSFRRGPKEVQSFTGRGLGFRGVGVLGVLGGLGL